MREFFVTGCDDNTEWQLPWFMDNFRQHNQEAKIVLADFGMSGPGNVNGIKQND